jgi:glycosyltransferase involved in cell wall biosynthesis
VTSLNTDVRIAARDRVLRHAGASAGPSFSVVIATYADHRFGQVEAAIASLWHQSEPPLEIVLVVDHNPALAAHARERFPAVCVLENRESRGLSGSRNTGLAVARGDIIAFLDDDAVAGQDWIARLRTCYADTRVLGVGGSITPSWSGRPRWLPFEFDWVVGCTYRGMPQARAAVRNLIGANMSFRREVFGEAGSFQVGIGRVGTRPVGCEETEFCIRASRVFPEGVLLYEPRAHVRHDVTPERLRPRYFFARCFAEGISKALVAAATGPSSALATERRFVWRTLPAGVVRGLGGTASLRDPSGVVRAFMIVAGTVTTTAGYAVGRLVRRESPRGAAPRGGTSPLE